MRLEGGSRFQKQHTSIPVASLSFLSLCGAASLARSMSISGVSATAVLAVVDTGGTGVESAAVAEAGEGSAGAASPSTSANLAIETSLRREVSLLRGGMVTDQGNEISREGAGTVGLGMRGAKHQMGQWSYNEANHDSEDGAGESQCEQSKKVVAPWYGFNSLWQDKRIWMSWVTDGLFPWIQLEPMAYQSQLYHCEWCPSAQVPRRRAHGPCERVN